MNRFHGIIGDVVAVTLGRLPLRCLRRRQREVVYLFVFTDRP